MEKENLLQISNLSIQFGGLKAVNEVTLNVDRDETVGLIGPNGAGKTSLFNSITGSVPPTYGDILFMNQSLVKKRPDEICRMGISRTFQNIRLFPKMTSIENISIGMHSTPKYSMLEAVLRLPKVRASEKEVRDRAQYYLELLGLNGYEKYKAGELAYGLQRRLEIARALATSPKLLLLDEPAAGMNNDECNELTALIKNLKKELNLTIIVIEHHMDIVMQLCKRIYVLNLGSVLAEGAPKEIQTNPEVQKAYLGERRQAHEQRYISEN